MYAGVSAVRGKRQDLTGNIYTRLTVVSRDIARGNPTYYICRCSCGTEKSILADSLKKGRSKSCGCLRHDNAQQKFLDLKGSTQGFLTYVGETVPPVGSKTKTRFIICDCVCGATGIILQANKYTNGTTQSCGCLRAQLKNVIRCKDMIGQRIGRWTVISRAASTTQAMWNCICDCGTERAVVGGALRGGVSNGCGCVKIHKKRELRQADDKSEAEHEIDHNYGVNL